jgi:excisionase family DNA binding protein
VAVEGRQSQTVLTRQRETEMKDGAQYLRTRDIARLTGTSIRTVRRWLASGLLRSVRVGGARLVAKTDLESLLHPEAAE